MSLKDLRGLALFWLTWPLAFVWFRGRRGVRGLVMYGDDALLVRHFVGTLRWTMPGGGVHRGESPQAALVRELREELGLNITDDMLQEVGDYTVRDYGITYRNKVFICALTEKPPLQQSREIADAKWVSQQSIDNLRVSDIVIWALGNPPRA